MSYSKNRPNSIYKIGEVSFQRISIKLYQMNVLSSTVFCHILSRVDLITQWNVTHLPGNRKNRYDRIWQKEKHKQTGKWANKKITKSLPNWKSGRTSDLFLQTSLPLQTLHTRYYLITKQSTIKIMKRNYWFAFWEDSLNCLLTIGRSKKDNIG